MFPRSATVKWPARHPSSPQTQTLHSLFSFSSFSCLCTSFFEPLWLFIPSSLVRTPCPRSVFFFFFSPNFLSSHALLPFYSASCPFALVTPSSPRSHVFCYLDVAWETREFRRSARMWRIRKKAKRGGTDFIRNWFTSKSM